MHTLTKLLFGEFGHSHADDTIKKYLRDRAEWLKKQRGDEDFTHLSTCINKAFELEPEKCEHKNVISQGGSFVENGIFCVECGKKIEEPKPTLPSKIEFENPTALEKRYLDSECARKINEIIDYLKNIEK